MQDQGWIPRWKITPGQGVDAKMTGRRKASNGIATAESAVLGKDKRTPGCCFDGCAAQRGEEHRGLQTSGNRAAISVIERKAGIARCEIETEHAGDARNGRKCGAEKTTQQQHAPATKSQNQGQKDKVPAEGKAVTGFSEEWEKERDKRFIKEELEAFAGQKGVSKTGRWSVIWQVGDSNGVRITRK